MGGAKRAFVRLVTLGCSGRPDMKKVNEEYLKEKRENGEKYKRAVAMAKVAKLAATRRIGGALGSFFGANSRAVRKLALKTRRLALWDNTKAMQHEQRMSAICEHAVNQRLSFKESLSLVRSATRFDALQAQTLNVKAMETLVAWRADAGAKVVEALVEAVPALSAFRLRPEPAGPCVAIEVLPPEAKEVVEAAAWSQASIATTLPAALEEAWQLRHHSVRHEKCPPMPPPGEVVETNPCYEAGVCLCSEAGRKVKQVGNRLLVHMRRLFSTKSGHRQKLLEGFIVLRVTGEPGTDDMEQILGEDDVFGEVFLHIGLQYLKPFRPTFLEVSATEAGKEIAAQDGRMYVKATDLLRVVRGRTLKKNTFEHARFR